MTLYADDPDAHVDDLVTDPAGGALDFAPEVTTHTGITLDAQWVGAAVTEGGVTTRTLRTSLYADDGNDGNQLAGSRSYGQRLHVPGGNDVELVAAYLY